MGIEPTRPTRTSGGRTGTAAGVANITGTDRQTPAPPKHIAPCQIHRVTPRDNEEIITKYSKKKKKKKKKKSPKPEKK